MSSRTPAPEEFGRFRMPDLPGELFDDNDPLYAPLDRASFSREYDENEQWESEIPGFEGDFGGPVDERPRHRPRRPLDDEVEDIYPTRRSARVHDEQDDLPQPRRKQRRPVRDEGFGEPDVRRRPRRSARDDEYMASSRSASVLHERGDYREPVVRRPRRDNPAQPSVRTPSRQDHVIEQPRMQAEAATADFITGIIPLRGPATPRPRVRKPRNPAWQWQSIVMPQPRQMLVQAFPSWLMALSVLGTLGVMGFIPGGLPLWAPMILIPTLLLLLRADPDRHAMWGRAAIVNLVVVGAFFPLMIVRQSFLRVPFVEFGNGTLVMPILSTVLVILAMAVIALGSAFLSQEDPEYAGMLFLPAAMLVPFFAGATEITNLSTALVILGVIYGVVGLLTVVASMLPAAFPTLVAPIALALEFFILPVSESTPIFPLGAGMSAKLLFFVVLAVGVGLTIAVPMMAVWVRQVRRIVQGHPRSSARPITPAAA